MKYFSCRFFIAFYEPDFLIKPVYSASVTAVIFQKQIDPLHGALKK